MRYQPELDGLRAVAVGLVLAYHFDLVPFVTGGFVGVDVFFVLSGYLVTGVILAAMRRGAFTLPDFFAKRVRRLMPALIATVALTLAAGLVLLFPAQLEELATQSLAAQFQVSNVYLWRSVNYFGLQADQVFLLHTWSLGVEAQFYLAYPFAVMAAWRMRARMPRWAGPAALSVLGAASFALCLAVQPAKPEAAFYLLPTRGWEFAAGAIFAAAPGLSPKSPPARRALGIGGLALVMAGACLIDAGDPFPGILALPPVIGTMMVIASCGERPAGAGIVLASRPFRYVGAISYSLYLVHWPVIVFAGTLAPSAGWPVRAALCGASVLLAALLYETVEQRFRRPGRRTDDGTAQSRRVAPALGYVGALGVVAAACLVVLRTDGLPARFSPEVRLLASGSLDEDEARRACQGRVTARPACRLGAPGEPDALVWGDSHAHALAGAMDALLAARGQSGVLAFSTACPPVPSLTTPRGGRGCDAFNATLVSEAVRLGVDNVYLVSIWNYHRTGLYEASGAPVTDPAALAGALDELGGALAEHGIALRVVAPVPVQPRDVPTGLALAARFPVFGAPEYGADRHAEKTAFVRDAFAASGTVAEVIDPGAVMCAPDCAFAADGRALYSDNNHLSVAGAAFLGARLADAYGGTD